MTEMLAKTKAEKLLKDDKQDFNSMWDTFCGFAGELENLDYDSLELEKPIGKLMVLKAMCDIVIKEARKEKKLNENVNYSGF